MSILIGNGVGCFSAPTSYRVIAFNSDVTVTDLNNDGKLDIVAGTYRQGSQCCRAIYRRGEPLASIR